MKYFHISKTGIIDLLEKIHSPVTVIMVDILSTKGEFYWPSFSDAVKGTENVKYNPSEDLWEFNHFSPIGGLVYGWRTNSGNILIIEECYQNPTTGNHTYNVWCTGGLILEWLEKIEFEDSLLDEDPE
jgi:hypothetical protein